MRTGQKEAGQPAASNARTQPTLVSIEADGGSCCAVASLYNSKMASALSPEEDPVVTPRPSARTWRILCGPLLKIQNGSAGPVECGKERHGNPRSPDGQADRRRDTDNIRHGNPRGLMSAGMSWRHSSASRARDVHEFADPWAGRHGAHGHRRLPRCRGLAQYRMSNPRRRSWPSGRRWSCWANASPAEGRYRVPSTA